MGGSYFHSHHTRTNMQRKVTIQLHPQATHAERHTHAAIGYLASWALAGGRFPDCHIYQDAEGNLSANYLTAADSLGYSIFALRDENGTFSYHS